MRRRQEHKEEDGPTEQELRSKLDEYIHFIDHTLQPQLKIAISQREEVESEIKEYEELKSNLRMMKQDKIKDEAMVDLGHELIYCQAKITDRKHVFVHVGMGFHAEFTMDEAIIFIDRRIGYLSRDRLSDRVDKARQVASHLENALELLESLGGEIRNMAAAAGGR